MSADGFHADGEARENGVAGDVGKAESEGSAGERELAKAAEEEHGNEGAGVEEKAGEDHGEGDLGNGKGLSKGQGEMGINLFGWFMVGLLGCRGLRDQRVCKMHIGRLQRVIN